MTQDNPRRKFLQWGLAAGAASLFPVLLLRAGSSGKKLSLRLAGHKKLMRSAELREQAARFADLVRQHSAGEIEVELPDSCFDYSQKQIFSAHKSGRIDIAVLSPSLHGPSRRHPADPFFGALPMGLPSEKKMIWLTSDEGSELWSELYRPLGVHPLFFGCGPSSYGQVSARPITSLKDLRGLRALSIDARSEWLVSVGIQLVPRIDWRRMSSALKKGSLDLIEPLQHSANLALALHRHGAYYQNAWLRSSYTYELLIPRETWKSLPPDARAVLREAATSAGVELHGKIAIRENTALKEIEAQVGAIRTFPNDVIRHFESYSDEFRKRIAAHSGIASEIHRAYSSFESRLA